jgi:hypothetical protein
MLSWGSSAGQAGESGPTQAPEPHPARRVLKLQLRRTTEMARRYSPSASKDVKSAMRRRKRGTLKSGGSGKTVKSRKQAIAIGLSEARKKGKKVPKKRAKK